MKLYLQKQTSRVPLYPQHSNLFGGGFNAVKIVIRRKENFQIVINNAAFVR